MKPSRRRRNVRIAQDVLSVLSAKYPRCFSMAEPKPLAIGMAAQSSPIILKSGGAISALRCPHTPARPAIWNGSSRTRRALISPVPSPVASRPRKRATRSTYSRFGQSTGAEVAESTTMTKSVTAPPEPPPAPPKRASLSDLRQAAKERRKAG